MLRRPPSRRLPLAPPPLLGVPRRLRCGELREGQLRDRLPQRLTRHLADKPRERTEAAPPRPAADTLGRSREAALVRLLRQESPRLEGAVSADLPKQRCSGASHSANSASSPAASASSPAASASSPAASASSAPSPAAAGGGGGDTERGTRREAACEGTPGTCRGQV